MPRTCTVGANIKLTFRFRKNDENWRFVLRFTERTQAFHKNANRLNDFETIKNGYAMVF